MTNTTPHRATAEQWTLIERFVKECTYDSCLIELRSRVEALEAAASASPKFAPAGSLVERVGYAIAKASGISNPFEECMPDDWSPEARAAIRAVAEWLRGQQELGAQTWAWHLEQEANR